ncbi:sex peptide receptor-like [Physella acuta]|uniref:sex peptide receptor-like n=1 Tax=Physella acuta TaxID=109671 RepID=UPI0027DD05B3|nr:sex peptide receptor-like [Physella acuta]
MNLTNCDQLCAFTRCFLTKNTETAQELLRCMATLCAIILPKGSESLVSQLRQELSPNTSALGVDDYNNCSGGENVPYRLDTEFYAKYAVPLNGYISPVLVLLTVINNSLVCIVLLKPHMRSPTNAILVAMALSDMFTGLFPVPVFLFLFGTERFYDWIPYDWCFMVKASIDYIPTIFHTASIWLTMALAIQRYIYVCHSFKARTWCTTENVIYGTVAIYFFATLSQILRFFESSPVETRRNSMLNFNNTVSTCIFVYNPWVQRHLNLYYSLYYWFRSIFINLLPCVSLVVMNALLIYAMRVAQRRRMQLLRQNKKSESRKLKESNCTTLMLVAVVGLFLLVEFPLGLFMVILIFQETFGTVLIRKDLIQVISLFSNFFILLSYPLNFFIYCGMSKQFRETFKRLFTGETMPMEREYSQYMTLPTENGKSTAVTGDETAL